MPKDALAVHAETAPSPAMRQVARTARSLGIPQEELARRVGLSPSTVSRQFRSRKPHPSTLQKYFEALGFPSEYLELRYGPGPSDEIIRRYEARLLADLNEADQALLPGTINEFRTYWSKLSNQRRYTLVRIFAVVDALDDLSLLKSKWRGFIRIGSIGLRAVAHAVRREFDFQKRLVQGQPGDDALVNIYHTLISDCEFSHKECMPILHQIVVSIQRNGRDPTQLIEALKRDVYFSRTEEEAINWMPFQIK